MKFLVLCLLLVNASPASQAIPVNDCTDLQNLNNDLSETYTLTNDIDCGNSSQWNDGAGFIPIGSGSLEGFCGSLDGQNYTIWYLEINRPTTDDVGLFSHLCATGQVYDLQLHNCSIHANDYIGAIVAINEGFIGNINASGRVTGQNTVGGLVSWNTGYLNSVQFIGNVTCPAFTTNTGGIAAVNSYGQIIKASFFGIIKGGQSVGGIVSENTDASIIQVKFSGEITGDREYTGGLVAQQQQGGILTNGQVTANITGVYDVGGVVGANYGSISSVRFEGSVVGLSPGDFIGGLAGYNGATIHDCQVNATIFGTHVTGGAVGSNIGRIEEVTIEGTVLTRLESSHIGGLIGQNSGTLLNGNFTGIVQGLLYVGGAVGYSYGNGQIRSIRFWGVVTGYDDIGDTIGGLVGYNGETLIDAHAVGQISGSYYVGGAVGDNPGEISSVTFEGTVVGQNPGEAVGGLVGQLAGSLSNSFVNATVTGTYRVGGAVGHSYGVIQNTQSYSTVISEDRLTGGFIGENTVEETGGIISDSTFFGNVTGQIIVAGFIGANTGIVHNCSSSGTITGGASVGGFIAQNAGIVTNCTTNATVHASSDRVGGIVADNQATGTISDCLSNATLLGERDDVGAIVGLNAGSVTRCQGYGTVHARDRVGGLIGRQLFTGELKQSYTHAEVFAEFDRAGGAVGDNAGLIEECASLSHVSGQDEVGGLIGRSTDTTNNVSDSYAAGCVESKSSKGGLTGSQANGIFTNVYWDTETTLQQDPAGKSGSFNLRSYGKSTRDLYHERTYSSWKFGDQQTWSIIEGQTYPYHQQLDLEKLPVAPELHCPRETTFFEIWIPRILFLISAVALGLWLDALYKHYTHRNTTQRNLQTTSNTFRASIQIKSTGESFKLETPLIRETRVGHGGHANKVPTDQNQLNRALLNAALTGHYDLAVSLASQGANPLMATENHQTALHLVVMAGSRLTAYHLMNLSSDPTVWSCHFERTLLALNENGCAITDIDISAHSMNDEQFRRLIDSISKHNTVKSLNVSYNSITDLGAVYFARQASRLNALQTVNLNYNLLSDDGVWELKQKLPSQMDVLIKGNQLLSTNRNDWALITTAPTGLLAYLSATMNPIIPLEWRFTLAKYQVIPTFGFFMGILDKVLDGLLILELDQTYQEDLTLISFSFFVISALVVGLLAIRILYGTWLPHQLTHILRWILFLPLLTPELVRLVTGMGYIDSPLAILRFTQFLLDDIPQFVISIIFLNRKGFNLIALSRLCFSFVGSVGLFINTLYNVPTLRNSLRQLTGSTNLLMTQLRLQET